MDDLKIIELLFMRNENALSMIKQKYGVYLKQVISHLLENTSDIEEILNDTYLKTWQAIPPNRPNNLKYYLAKIARNLALNRLDYMQAKCRDYHVQVVFDELEECLGDVRYAAFSLLDATLLKDSLNRFLASLDKKTCAIFLERYFYALTIKEIALKYCDNERHVKYVLEKTRAQLKVHLESDGIIL